MGDKIESKTSTHSGITEISEKSFNKLNDNQKELYIAGLNDLNSKSKDAGAIGSIFGTNVKNASIHIAFIICCVLILFCGIDLIHSFSSEKATITKEIWDLIFPVITLALGYIFGKGESN